MASVATPSYHSTKETTNYARLCRLLVDAGSDALRDAFDKSRPTGDLNSVLSSPPVHAVLQSLRKKRILNPSQWGKLYPAIKSAVSSKNFDITLLMVLLRNICGLVRPATGWDTLPPATDTTLEADVVRIKCYRNTVYGHVSQASVDDPTFNQYWQDIQGALVRLGGASYQSAIDDLKKECIDPDFEEHYRELLKQWVMDEVSVKERLDEIEEKLSRKLDDWKESIENPEKKTGVGAVTAYTNALKASVKSRTEFHTLPSPTMKKARTDDIYTSLLIQHGRKPIEDQDMKRKERLRQYGRVSGEPVKHNQEIFICDTDRNVVKIPRSVLVTGKAGIGKTLFFQKFIRDWANNMLFETQANLQLPDLKFAYLLTFRQLNSLGDDRVTLRDILNRSSVLDEHSNIEDSVFEYILDHSEEVLILIDGYDEYSKRNFIESDWDDRYPNSAHEEMPVAALCAKLIKGKLLRDSVVMITSRPDESDEMTSRIGFDRYVEITGFTEEQVKKYVEKYFNEKEVMKNAVMDHITKNDNLVSFAHIPVVCFLMCSYFEYLLNEPVNTDVLPVNTSEIYFEVVNMFLGKHDKESAVSSEDTLDKMSEFAAHLLQERKFIFALKDMKRFTLEEVKSLRANGLLHCGPPFRKSYTETTKYFCFTHFTLQEYLAARWFVKRKQIPSHRDNVSEMIFQFMSGILSKQKDEFFMRALLERLDWMYSIRVGVLPKLPKLLKLQCVMEYQEKNFAQRIVKERFHQFCDRDGVIEFEKLAGADCTAVAFLLDVIRTLNADKITGEKQEPLQQSSVALAKTLTLWKCHLSETGLRVIYKALEKKHSPVTELYLYDCVLQEKCVHLLGESLLVSKLNELGLVEALITDADVVSLCQALKTPTCKVATLNLFRNQITDVGVASICQPLQTPTCKVTTLNLGLNQITDAGVASLCHALQTPTCKVTTLDLCQNQITDVGVVSLCQALQTPTCKVTTLDLCHNQITDAGVVSLCQALQTPTCKLTTLQLSHNRITDAGVVSLCQVLQTPTCKLTKLDLGYNQITAAGVNNLFQAFQTPTCKVTELRPSHNQFIRESQSWSTADVQLDSR